MPNLNRRHPLRRRHMVDADDTLRLLIAKGDVADVLPADLLPSRSLEEDKNEVTRYIEGLAGTGGIDRATGGHLLDEQIASWHNADVAAIKRVYLSREATADRLVGAAERAHQSALESFGFAAERYSRHAAAAERALIELIGKHDSPDPPHVEMLRQAAARIAGHDSDCFGRPAWTPPWGTTNGAELTSSSDE